MLVDIIRSIGHKKKLAQEWIGCKIINGIGLGGKLGRSRIMVRTVLAFLAFFFALSACQSNSEPNQQQIESYVMERFSLDSKGLEIVRFDFKNFSGTTVGEGRTSIRGTLKSSEDRFVEVNDRIAESLVSAGVPVLSANDLVRSSPKRKPFKLLHPAGTLYSFNVEAVYRENVSGFDFKYTSSDFPGSKAGLKVVPRSKLGPEAYMVGTDEETAIFNELLAIYKEMERKEAAEKRERAEAKAKAPAIKAEKLEALMLGSDVGKFDKISAKKGDRIGPLNLFSDRCIFWTIYGSADILSRPDQSSEPVKANLVQGTYTIESWGHNGAAVQVFFVATSNLMEVEIWRKKGQACN